jgi:hypothetical protein
VIWPQFATLQPLGAQRAWTATFDAGDEQRGYYLVRLLDEEHQRQSGELVAEVGAGDVEHVRARLAAIAAIGKSNTAHAPEDERWRPSDLESYRAAHPFVADAVARTDRPDWGVRLAFEAATGDDRKRVLAVAAGQARLLRGAGSPASSRASRPGRSRSRSPRCGARASTSSRRSTTRCASGSPACSPV